MNIYKNRELKNYKKIDAKIKEIVKNLISHYNIDIKSNNKYNNTSNGKLALKLQNILLSFIIDFTKKYKYIHEIIPSYKSDIHQHPLNLFPVNLGKLNYLSRDKKKEIEDIRKILNESKNIQNIEIPLGIIVSKYEINAQKNLSFNFLHELFKYIAPSIKKDKVKDILAYIIYVLLKKDIYIRLPANIDNKTKNLKNVHLDEKLEILLNLIEESIKGKIRSLLILLKEKMHSSNRSERIGKLNSSQYFGNNSTLNQVNRWTEGVRKGLAEYYSNK
jgi:hypothetical protein